MEGGCCSCTQAGYCPCLKSQNSCNRWSCPNNLLVVYKWWIESGNAWLESFIKILLGFIQAAALWSVDDTMGASGALQDSGLICNMNYCILDKALVILCVDNSLEFSPAPDASKIRIIHTRGTPMLLIHSRVFTCHCPSAKA